MNPVRTYENSENAEDAIRQQYILFRTSPARYGDTISLRRRARKCRSIIMSPEPRAGRPSPAIHPAANRTTPMSASRNRI